MPLWSMTTDASTLGMSISSLALSALSLLLALSSSPAWAMLLGLVAGVLLAPHIGRAATWLTRYLAA